MKKIERELRKILDHYFGDYVDNEVYETILKELLKLYERCCSTNTTT